MNRVRKTVKKQTEVDKGLRGPLHTTDLFDPCKVWATWCSYQAYERDARPQAMRDSLVLECLYLYISKPLYPSTSTSYGVETP